MNQYENIMLRLVALGVVLLLVQETSPLPEFPLKLIVFGLLLGMLYPLTMMVRSDWGGWYD